MKRIKQIMTITFLMFMVIACDNEVSYDQFDVAPIIEDVDFTVTVDNNTRIVSLVATAVGNDYFEISWGDETVQESVSGSESHTYNEPGNYTIKVVARKDGLVNKSSTQAISVALISNLVITTDIDVSKPAEIILNVTATNATNYDIDWGDGSAIENTTSNMAVHTYIANGDYEIKVTANADGFSSVSGQTQVTISRGLNFVLNKNFESGDLSDWIEGYPGALSIVPDPTNPSNNVLKYDSAISGGWNSSLLPFSETTPDGVMITAEFSFFPTGIEGWSDFYRLSENGAGGQRVKFQHSGDANSYRLNTDGGEFKTMTVSYDTWHTLKIVVDPSAGTVIYTLDGDAAAAVTVTKGDTETLEGYSHFDIGNNGNNDMFIDNIKISYIEN